jgi:hypothetical protein
MMAKKRTERIVKASADTKQAMYANAYGIMPSTTHILLDFGYVAPSYYEEDINENIHLARICMDWDMVEDLCKALTKSINIKNKERKGKG